ncbi:MAG: helix-turn-helix domain-containing protein [Clostridia bacterium]|nr:helix-turn-helix domain-containing protein [Clostridia bacterium]
MPRKKVLNLKFANYTSDKENLSQRNGILCKKTWTSKKFFPMHNHNYMEIEYLTSGTIIEELNGIEFKATAGDFHCLDHCDTHSFISVDPPFHFNNICFDIRKIPTNISELLRSVQFPFVGSFSKEAFEKVNNYFEIMYSIQSSDEPYTEETLYSYFALIIIEVLKAGKTLQTNNSKSTYKYAKAAGEYIENNYKNNITLNEIAKHLNLAPNYLSQIFPKYYGCGFIEYLNSYRITVAKKLIISTDLSLTEIALDSGFSNHCAFSRAFNKYEGCSAREFKRKYKNFDSI